MSGMKSAEQLAKCLLVSTFANAAAFAAYFQQEEKLLLDGVEQRIQRPRQHEVQKDFYSGKKSVRPSKP
jgi:hypothetical protein